MHGVTLRESVLQRCVVATERADSGDPCGGRDALGDLYPDSGSLTGELRAEVLLALGAIGFMFAVDGRGSHEKAKDFFAESSRLFSEHGNQKAEDAQVRLANCYLRQGGISEAFVILDGITQTSSDVELVLCASISKAFGLTQSNHLHEALRTLQAAEKMLDHRPTITGKFYNQRGIIYRKLQKIDDCLRDYQQARYWFEVAGNLRYQAAVLNNLAMVYG